MYKDISPAVTTHLSLLLALCDPITPKRIVQQLLKTADKRLLTAIGELLLNSKDTTLSSKSKNLITKKRTKLEVKRITLTKHWKQIG